MSERTPMKIWRGIGQVPQPFKCVATIGVFDGLHLGHQMILERTCAQARERGVKAVALTFDPHPLTLHRPEFGVELITSLEQRLELLEAYGLDAVIVEPYVASLAQLSAEEFVANYFVHVLGAQALVVGEDVRLGRNNSGDAAYLLKLGEKYGFDVTIISDLKAPDGRRWSSSWIREALGEGDVSQAAKVLGRHHRLCGTVVHGHKLGRQLGFPTANLAANGVGVVPADGVYAGYLTRRLPGAAGATESLPAAISVGTNPQFERQLRTVEAHVLGRSDLDLYGEQVSVEFVENLRPMRVFESVEALLGQMDEDLRATAAVLSVPVTGRVDPAAVTAGAQIPKADEAHR